MEAQAGFALAIGAHPEIRDELAEMRWHVGLSQTTGGLYTNVLIISRGETRQIIGIMSHNGKLSRIGAQRQRTAGDRLSSQEVTRRFQRTPPTGARHPLRIEQARKRVAKRMPVCGHISLA
jgi:hypothetical protein